MPRFFHEVPSGDSLIINGPDAQHIRRALRMQPGEHLTVCDGQGTDYACQIAAFEGEGVRLSVLSQAPSCTEPSLAVTLYQGLPKGDKMDWILGDGGGAPGYLPQRRPAGRQGGEKTGAVAAHSRRSRGAMRTGNRSPGGIAPLLRPGAAFAAER